MSDLFGSQFKFLTHQKMAHFFDGLVFYHIGELKEVVQSSVSIRASTGLSNRKCNQERERRKTEDKGQYFPFGSSKPLDQFTLNVKPSVGLQEVLLLTPLR